jgi:D-serine deaminase-like pyridoxal phosphate-dependent protein
MRAPAAGHRVGHCGYALDRRMDETALGSIASQRLGPMAKGLPLDGRFETAGDLRAARLSVFGGEFSTPFAVLHGRAIRNNARKMAQYCAENDVLLAPHAKTSMAPQLFAAQLSAGAWGLTVATVWQAALCRSFGVQRLLLANELVDPAAVAWAVGALADPGFALLSYVDSAAQVERADAALQDQRPLRPLDVLLEVGYLAGRTGCRNTAAIEATVEAITRSKHHRLVGVAGFEGLLGRDAQPETLATVRDYLRRVRRAAEHVADIGALGGADPVLLSAGGSMYFDLVTEELSGAMPDGRAVQVILRCGGYLTHETGPYSLVSPFARLPRLADAVGPLEPAIEVWASVLARPEPTLAILDAGKRDLGVDTGMPEPVRLRRLSGMTFAPRTWQVVGSNDQHVYLTIGQDDLLSPGDLVSLGISHPCTFFDKWTWIPMVDDDYRLTDVIRTYF